MAVAVGAGVFPGVLASAGDGMACIGRVREDRTIVFQKNAVPVFSLTCDEAKRAWQEPLNF